MRRCGRYWKRCKGLRCERERTEWRKKGDKVRAWNEGCENERHINSITKNRPNKHSKIIQFSNRTVEISIIQVHAWFRINGCALAIKSVTAKSKVSTKRKQNHTISSMKKETNKPNCTNPFNMKFVLLCAICATWIYSTTTYNSKHYFRLFQ